MYPFIETIRIEDGQIYNLDYHTERFNRTRAVFWKDSVPLDLCKYISPPVLNGIHKCRIVYGKEVEGEKELVISVKVIPNYEKIEEKHGKDLSEDEIRKIIWEEIKKVNKQLTSYKAIKNLEIKKDEFEKTTTMKIKRFAEIKKDKENQEK